MKNRLRFHEILNVQAALLGGYMSGGGLPWQPAPEKYPGQRQAFRKGAWKGDGVPADSARSKGRKCRQT